MKLFNPLELLQYDYIFSYNTNAITHNFFRIKHTEIITTNTSLKLEDEGIKRNVEESYTQLIIHKIYDHFIESTHTSPNNPFCITMVPLNNLSFLFLYQNRRIFHYDGTHLHRTSLKEKIRTMYTKDNLIYANTKNSVFEMNTETLFNMRNTSFSINKHNDLAIAYNDSNIKVKQLTKSRLKNTLKRISDHKIENKTCGEDDMDEENYDKDSLD